MCKPTEIPAFSSELGVPIDVNKAVQKAYDVFRALYENTNADLESIRVEEVRSGGGKKNAHWKVTLSVAVPARQSPAAIAFAGPRFIKEYKTIVINGKTGDPERIEIFTGNKQK